MKWPIINLQIFRYQIDNEQGVYYEYDNRYTIDNSSLNFLWNNAVINSQPDRATIENMQTEVVILDPNLHSAVSIGGDIETVGFYDALTGTLIGITNVVPHQQIVNRNVAVRITFDVVPNNNAPKSTIVKTFKAQLVQQ